MTGGRIPTDMTDITIECADSLTYTDWPDDTTLILTDPPYGTTIHDWDAHAPGPDRLWTLFDRIDAAGVITFGSFPLLAGLMAARPAMFRYELVWAKRRPTGHLSAGRRPLRAHELIGVFGHPPYTSIPRPRHAEEPGYRGRRRRRTPGGPYDGDGGRRVWVDDDTRRPDSILHAATGPWDGSKHPTAKPVALIRWLIRSYTHPGDLVVDPFAGAGPVAVAALLEGRRALCVERDSQWAAEARRRIGRLRSCPPLDVGDPDTLDLSRFGWGL